MSRVLALLRLVGVVVAGAGLVFASVRLPLASLDLTTGTERAAAAQASRTRLAGVGEVVCPGPETIGVQGSRAKQALAGTPSVVAAAPPVGLLGAHQGPGGTLRAALLPPASPNGRADSVIAADADPRRQRGDLHLPAAAVVSATGAMAPGLTAEQTTVTTAGDLRGLTTVTCTPPMTDTWLVGGGGQQGRRGRLVLANPAANPVSVRIDVLSASGPVPAAPGSTVAVAGRSRVVLLLDALAPGVRSPVVHVQTTGGAVTATLHDARLNGTTPMGTDDVAPAAAPARQVLVPGLTISGRALLRLAAPGDAEAVGEVRLFGPNGPVDPPGGAAVRVPAGGTLDVDLTGLPAGTYGAQVRTDVPVVAGGMVERTSGAGGPADLAWLASARPVTTITGLAAVRSQRPWSTTVELTAPGTDAAVDVTSIGADGSRQTQTLRVAAGHSTITVLDSAQSAWLRPVPGSGPVVAARTLTFKLADGRLIAAASLTDLPTTEVVPVVRPAG